MEKSCCEPGVPCACGCTGDRKNKLCEMTKPHNQFKVEEIMPLVNKAKYFCRCCGRLANKKENLCNPIALSKLNKK